MNRIRSERERHGWSQAELARRAGMHNSTVNQIENGRMLPYPNQLAKIVAALGWAGEPAELLQETDHGSS